MSLDVYLEMRGEKKAVVGPQIFIREDGQTKEITRKEWNRRFPGREPVAFESQEEDDKVYSANITHNLNRMAEEAGIYKHLWRPEEIGISKAHQLVAPLRTGLAQLKGNPEEYKKFNPENGWGNYEGLVKFVEDYITACEKYPDADVRVWR